VKFGKVVKGKIEKLHEFKPNTGEMPSLSERILKINELVDAVNEMRKK